jgi:phosphatidylglycerophosphate synthase
MENTGYKTSSPIEEATPRNSTLRGGVVGKTFDKLADFLVRKWPEDARPDLLPDFITYAGTAGVTAANVALFLRPDTPTPSTAMFAAGGLLDNLDGRVARKLQEKYKEKYVTDPTKGMLTDTVADRIQELVTLGSLSLVARRHGNKVAASLYAIGFMTAVLSAWYRAEAESNGYVVTEEGPGTRVSQAVCGGIGMEFNNQPSVSTVVAARIVIGGIKTSYDRKRVIRDGDKAPCCVGMNTNPDFMEAARIRKEALTPLVKASGVIGGIFLAASVVGPRRPKNART